MLYLYAMSCGPFSDKDQRIIDRHRQIEPGYIQLHPSRLDFRQIQYVVYQQKQMASGGHDIAHVLVLFVVQLAEQLVGKDLGKADDCGQGSAQLVRHVGEKLRLMPVGGLDLAALVFDLPEQPRVLNRQGRLRREGLQKIDDLR